MMVSTSSSHQTIYRSVPPRPLSYGLPDMLDPRVLGYVAAARHRSNTAPMAGISPEEFAHRFKARPTTRPRIIEFDGSSVSSKSKYRHPSTPMSNGFPTARARIYIGQPKARTPSEQTENITTTRTPYTSSGRLQLLTPLQSSPNILLGGAGGGANTGGHAHNECLTPASPAPLPAAHITHKTLQGNGHQYYQQRYHERSSGALSGGSSSKTSQHSKSHQYGDTKRMMTKSASALDYQTGDSVGVRSSTGRLKSDSLRATSQSTELGAAIPRDLLCDEAPDHIYNPEILLSSSNDCDDLCALPPPKKVLPKREVPWVFRYKVKKGMNTLSRIMASKPTQSLQLQTGKVFV